MKMSCLSGPQGVQLTFYEGFRSWAGERDRVGPTGSENPVTKRKPEKGGAKGLLWQRVSSLQVGECQCPDEAS